MSTQEKTPQQLNNQRHSAAHVLMQALMRMYPDARPGVGPSTEDGFYHDFTSATQVTEKDLPRIEKEMQKIIKENLPITSEIKAIDDGVAWLEERGYHHTKELAEDLKKAGENEISFYAQGEFTNMCRGGHAASTKEVGVVKLTKIAGAYWKGDEKREMMQRIYGVVFDAKQELADYVTLMREAEKRDHRKLGRELDLFVFSEKVGPGLPMFTPKGALMRRLLEEFVQSLQEPRGYERVTIPHMARPMLYKTSGHWDKFKDGIFHVFGSENAEHENNDKQYVLKPMNCPHHTQIYDARPRSYRDLPLRYSEVTSVYRDEQHGELSGLSRVLMITQDDAHVFCRPDQVHDEALLIYEIVEEFYKPFGMELRVQLSAHDPEQPEKYLGTSEVWQQAESQLEHLLKEKGATYTKVEGEAAFYGPKIDFVAHDALRRKWQLATIQLDFNLPERFDLTYANDQGKRERVVMLHRAILGSVERFMSILIEHYAGVFPLWLSPVQVAILPVGETFDDSARDLQKELVVQGIRATVDHSDNTVSKKIREAEKQKTPYMLVFGKKEASADVLAVRARGSQAAQEMSRRTFANRVLQEVEEKK